MIGRADMRRAVPRARSGTFAALAEVGIDLDVYCEACRENHAFFNVDELAARYGADYLVERWRRRLACSKCGKRNVTIKANSRAANAATAVPQGEP
jgi:hypothetical protein